MWLFLLAFCFLRLLIYASVVLLRLLPQIIAATVVLFVAIFVVARIIDAIVLIESAATCFFDFMVDAITYFVANFWMIFGVMLGIVVAASLVWMIVPPAFKRAKRQARRYYNRRTMYLMDHEG